MWLGGAIFRGLGGAIFHGLGGAIFHGLLHQTVSVAGGDGGGGGMGGGTGNLLWAVLTNCWCRWRIVTGWLIQWTCKV